MGAVSRPEDAVPAGLGPPTSCQPLGSPTFSRSHALRGNRRPGKRLLRHPRRERERNTQIVPCASIRLRALARIQRRLFLDDSRSSFCSSVGSPGLTPAALTKASSTSLAGLRNHFLTRPRSYQAQACRVGGAPNWTTRSWRRRTPRRATGRPVTDQAWSARPCAVRRLNRHLPLQQLLLRSRVLLPR